MKNTTKGKTLPVTQRIHNLLSRNRIRYSAFLTAIVLFALLLFVGVNFACQVLDVQLHWQTDMTTQKMYTIGQEALDYLRQLDRDVTITIVQEESAFDAKTIQALRNYDAASDRIAYQYINLDVNPGFAAPFRGQTIRDSSIIIQSGSRYQILEETDLYYLNSNGNVTGLRADQRLCSAIAFVTGEDTVSLGVVSGHGSSLPSELGELCAVTNRQVQELSLLVEEIPESVDILVIYEPSVDFVPAEIKKLDDWLLEGGHNLLVLSDIQNGVMPVLEAYLTEWGLQLQNDIVLDSQHYWGGNEMYLLAGYSKDSQVGKTALEGQLSLAVPLCRSIQLDSGNNNLSSCTQFPIIKSFDTSVREIFREDGETTNQTGSFVLGAGSTKLLANVAGQEVSSTVFVYGSSFMATDSMLASSALGNRTVLLDSLLHNKQRLEIMDIPITALKSYALDITSGQIEAIRLVTMYILPLGLCVLGGGVYLKRKKR